MTADRICRVHLLIATALSTLLLSTMSLIVISRPAQAEPTLNFLNESLDLTLEFKEATDTKCSSETGKLVPVSPGEEAPVLKTAKTTVWVRYTGGTEPLGNLRFRAQAAADTVDEERNPTPIPKDVNVCWEALQEDQGAIIEPRALKPFAVSLEVGAPPRDNLPEWPGLLSLTEQEREQYWKWFLNPYPPYKWSKVSGYMVVEPAAPNQEVVPGTLSLQLISPARGYKTWFHYPLEQIAFRWAVITLFSGLVIVLMRASLRSKLFGKLPDFDIKGGWASTLTTAGAVLGTFLSAGFLPEDTFFMARGQYTALNVIFGLIILLAYVLFRLIPYGLTLLAAGALILGAAAGELATVWLLLYELDFQGVLPSSTVPLLGISIVSLLQLILAGAAILVTLLAGRKALQVIKGKTNSGDDKAVVRSFYEVWKSGDLAELDKILAPYYVDHDPLDGQEPGIEGAKQKATYFHERFDNLRFDFRDQFAGEGKVTSRITMRAVRRGEAENEPGTSREVSGKIIDICRIADGKIVEQWSQHDIASGP